MTKKFLCYEVLNRLWIGDMYEYKKSDFVIITVEQASNNIVASMNTYLSE